MKLTPADIDSWLGETEGEQLELKEARTKFSFEKLAEYCCAFANEGGGRVVLGISDKRPRRVVGSKAFPQPEEPRRSLMERLPLRIDVQEVQHPDGRVLVFSVPPRPLGVPVKYEGVYWSRAGDSLVPMDEPRLRAVFAEIEHDFSADLCPGATMEDLDPTAIGAFRRRWAERSGNGLLASASDEQLLRDAELVVGRGITYAALVLFGTRTALNRLLAQAEVIFEYRSSEAAGPAQQRVEYRQAFFTFYDDLWATIALRNDLQHYQDGLFMNEVPTFDERSVREAVLNAVCHRDYRDAASVFVRQYQRRLVVNSPGGFPPGITVDNILDQQKPRNRLLAEALARCGLVERAGQGMNLMFERSIRQGKARPDFTGTDDHFVVLTLRGELTDPQFVRFLEKVGEETGASFDAHDFLVLDLVHAGESVPEDLLASLGRLVEVGVVERVGRGRGSRYLLSRRFYSAIGQAGTYTRRLGLDRETNKALLRKHIDGSGSEGSPFQDLAQVLPAVPRSTIQRYLRELKDEGHVRVEGKKKGARWVSESPASDKKQN